LPKPPAEDMTQSKMFQAKVGLVALRLYSFACDVSVRRKVKKKLAE
jgi:hypothetical protein